jgi:glycosyltransferase involved in cell wall biosynthesis
MSVKKWIDMGIYDKEKIIFEEYIKNKVFDNVMWLTYGIDDDRIVEKLKYDNKLNKNINVLSPPDFVNFKLGAIIYSLIYSLWHYRIFRNTYAVTNTQTSGSWGILIGKIFLNYKFVYRYGHSLWRRHLFQKKYHRLLISWSIDKLLLRFADHFFCPTYKDYSCISSKKFTKKTTISPNFIDIKNQGLVKPWSFRSDKAVFLGRLVEVKNLENLVTACANKNIDLDIYGDGRQKEAVKYAVTRLKANVKFCGIIPNADVIDQLQKYKYFFLVSYYEAMPKALLEAMAAGTFCIVTPNYGCKEIVIDEVNGVIAHGYSASDIESAIERAFLIDGEKISKNAIDHVKRHYSLPAIVSRHKEIYLSLSEQ